MISLRLGSSIRLHSHRSVSMSIRREWMATRTPPEATFSVLGELPIPAMEGVSEALVILVSAQEFVRSVLCDDKGNLRANIFEQKCASFLRR